MPAGANKLSLAISAWEAPKHVTHADLDHISVGLMVDTLSHSIENITVFKGNLNSV